MVIVVIYMTTYVGRQSVIVVGDIVIVLSVVGIVVGNIEDPDVCLHVLLHYEVAPALWYCRARNVQYFVQALFRRNSTLNLTIGQSQYIILPDI